MRPLATALESARDNQLSTRVTSPAGNSPCTKTMAACTDGESVPGEFHWRCGDTVMLSEGKRASSAPCDCPIFIPPQIAFSSVPISKGLVFYVTFSQEGEGHVSPVIQKCTCNSLIQTPCRLQCTPCLDSVHTRAVRAQEQLVTSQLHVVQDFRPAVELGCIQRRVFTSCTS